MSESTNEYAAVIDAENKAHDRLKMVIWMMLGLVVVVFWLTSYFGQKKATFAAEKGFVMGYERGTKDGTAVGYLVGYGDGQKGLPANKEYLDRATKVMNSGK